MFTGIIEETGRITQVSAFGRGKRLTISARRILEALKAEDSVCVSGVCLTVVSVDKAGFTVEAVGVTLEKTTLSAYQRGRPVNLERALRLSDRLGGHLVQGHVNGIGKIVGIDKTIESWILEVELPEVICKYVIPEGSIAIDGISLTVASMTKNTVTLSIIPYTFRHTTLAGLAVGDRCNVETDMVANYVERLLHFNQPEQGDRKITREWLKKTGF